MPFFLLAPLLHVFMVFLSRADHPKVGERKFYSPLSRPSKLVLNYIHSRTNDICVNEECKPAISGPQKSDAREVTAWRGHRRNKVLGIAVAKHQVFVAELTFALKSTL
ncbi:hypothetical protein DL96DRAFT_1553204 [Flagelloscypha sp. PMI_526]|nr:hypothetical protein DL96DRAFT_1553204 [Flagelloscypha sp. PMI_526]